MRKLTLILVLCCAALLGMAQPNGSYITSINEGWQFQQTGREQSWQRVSIPHSWNALDAMDDEPGFYRGVGTYRRMLNVDSTLAGKQLYLYFEGANQTTRVLVNDREVALHKGGYTRFVADITPAVRIGADNDITLVVDNSHDAQIPPLSADFTFFGGVYRDVYLVAKSPVHFSLSDFASTGVYVRTPKVSKEQAEVEMEALITNATATRRQVNCTFEVRSPRNELVATLKGKVRLDAGVANTSLKLRTILQNPMLWDVDSPNLYCVTAYITDARTGEVLDQQTETFGLRWYEFNAQTGFWLNGRPLKLIGTSRHQCYPGKGYALDDALHLQDVRLLKEMGGNFLRVSHYPQDPLVLDLCDRLGIVTSVEIPIVNAITEGDAFLQNCLTMQEEMIKQNRNHPSVVIWAYMNEVMLRSPYDKKDERYEPYCQEVLRQATAIEQLTRRLDSERYTMIPGHESLDTYEHVGLVTLPRIVGWNLYNGWYSNGMEGFERFMQRFHEKYPNVPMIISEYGADVDSRIHSDRPERMDFSVEYGDLYQEHYLRQILQTDFLCGANLWNLNEFHSEPRADAVPHVNLKGIVTLDRRPKNTYWLYKASLSDEPFVQIASSDWTHRSAQLEEDGTYRTEIKVYSNQPRVALYHNGRAVGEKETDLGIARFDVALVNGANRLEATTPAPQRCTHAMTLRMNGIPAVLDEDFTELNVLLGSTRSFTDTETNICWIPEQEYREGSWGYVGGKANRPTSWSGVLPANAVDILDCDADPMYQTQRLDLEAFRADVPDGTYAVYLHWADLTKEEQTTLAYNLGSDAQLQRSNGTRFDVVINGQPVVQALDVKRAVGANRVLVKKTIVHVAKGEGLNISLQGNGGRTMLNAVRIVRTQP